VQKYGILLIIFQDKIKLKKTIKQCKLDRLHYPFKIFFPFKATFACILYLLKLKTRQD